MSPRERYLAIGVGLVAALFLGNMFYTSIRDGIAAKEALVQKAEDELQKTKAIIESGKRASVKLERLIPKSLPTEKGDAEAQYRAWLGELADQIDMDAESVITGQAQKVNLPATSNQRTPVEAYTVYEFTLNGKCRSEKIVDMLARYYNRNYLHRIKSLTVTRDKKDKGLVEIGLTSQVIALPKASADKEPSLESSGRLAMTTDDYRKKILNRNPFSPPNSGPKFETGRSHDIELGKKWSLQLDAKDPDGDRVNYELVTEADKLPPGAKFNRGTLEWQPIDKTTAEVLVRATDEGWPHKSTELKLSLRVVDPPIVKKEVTSAPDPASLSFMSARVQNKDESVEVWIRSKSEESTTFLRVGSDISIGSVEGKVLEIDKDFIVVESMVGQEARRWRLYMGETLADAYAKGIKD
ncbi:MAG: hypothetical protein U0930_23930 [Pirellulales bacterium]